MRKNSSPLNTSMFQNYKEQIQNIVKSDHTFYFINSIKGSQAYSKKLQSEVLAMIKQLSYPSFFLTLSCADSHWEEIAKLIVAANEHSFFRDELKTFFFSTSYIHVFKEMLLISTSSLSKINYHAIRIEFKARGSQHVQRFLSVLN